MSIEGCFVVTDLHSAIESEQVLRRRDIVSELIRVPDIGNGEGEVIELMVKVGDRIEADQSVLTLESDKASMEIPAPKAGVIKTMKVKLGDRLKEGDELFELEVEGEAAAAPAEAAAPAAAAPAPAEKPAEAAPAPAAAPAAEGQRDAGDRSQAAVRGPRPGPALARGLRHQARAHRLP